MVWVQNITMDAQYNGRHDNGTCLSAFDQDCIDALQTQAINRANLLVTTPSSYGPNSNLTNGALPNICVDIANNIKNIFPPECKKYWNETIHTDGNGKYGAMV